MFHLLAQWRKYPAVDRTILLQLAIMLPLADVFVRTLGFTRINRWLAREGGGTREDAAAVGIGQHIAALARLAGHRHPWPTSCLRQVIVVSYILRRQGVDSRIVIGVSRPLNEAPAHAWVEVGGISLDPHSMGHRVFGDLKSAMKAKTNLGDSIKDAKYERIFTYLIVAALISFLLGGLGPWAVRAGLTHMMPAPQLQTEPLDDRAPASNDRFAKSSSCPAPWQRPREDALVFYKASHRFGYLPVLASIFSGLVWLGMLGTAATQRHRSVGTSVEFRLTLWVLVAVSAAGAMNSAVNGRWLPLGLGLMALAPWLLAAATSSIATNSLRRRLALGFVLVLTLQALLAPFEVGSASSPYLTKLLGLEVHRLAGTFSTPTALGGFAVTTWAAAVCWGQFSRRRLALATALVLSVLLLVSSATAWIALALVVAATLFPNMKRWGRLAMLALTAPCMLLIWFLLPVITGRSDIHDSAWGRVLPVIEFTRTHLNATELLFGYRFGIGTQAFEALHLLAVDTVPAPNLRPPVDSTASVLFWQTGLVGVLAGYTLMLLALFRDKASRPLGVALFVSSFAFSIIEVLPLAIVLGLWFVHANFSGKR